MRIEEIHEHWREAGKDFDAGAPVTATSRDPHLGTLEREAVLRRLDAPGRLVDLGCGDASHTVHYAPHCESVVGVDYSESLLEVARSRIADANLENVELEAASALDLVAAVGEESADVIVSQRCLINLPTWEEQEIALEQAQRVLRPGGRLLITEGFIEGLEALNEVRVALELEPIEASAYNRFFEREAFEGWLPGRFDVVSTEHYGAYLLLSRTLHPLAVAPDQPRHDSVLNDAARRLQGALARDDLERYSYNLFYELRRV